MAVNTSALQALFNANHTTTPTPARPVAPAAPSAPSAPAAPTSAPAAAAPGFSATSDPVLQQIRDAGKASSDAARVAALPQAEQALIGYGGITPEVASVLRSIYGNDSSNPIIGALTDQNTLDAGAKNPYSTLAQLGKQHQANVTNTTEGFNKNNLFYSGHYAKALGDENYGYGAGIAKAGQGLQSQLAGIYGNVLNADTTANQNIANALPAAYSNYLAANPVASAPAAQTSAPPQAVLPATPVAKPTLKTTYAPKVTGPSIFSFK